MANVVICDRCKQLGMRLALGAMAVRDDLDDDTKSKHYEICPQCVAELHEWIDSPPKDRAASGVPFTEPYSRPEPYYGDSNESDDGRRVIETATPPARRGRTARRT